MTRNLIRALCIAGVVAACTDNSPTITESAPSVIINPPSPPPAPPPPPSASSLVGTLAFVSLREGVPHIYLSNPDGSDVRRLTNSTRPEVTPAWSRDGSQLAFSSGDDTYVVNRDGTGLIRLPVGGGWPSWSPDGKKLLVAAEHGLRIVPADGSAGDEVAIQVQDPTGMFADYDEGPAGANWSPDGTRIAFNSWTGWDFQRAFVANIDGTAARTFVGVVNNAIWDECGAVWSPDGTRIALLGGVFGGLAFPVGIFAVGIVDPETGDVTPIAVTGTTCWDESYSSVNSFSGVAWSPDQKSLAITNRSPSWNSNTPWSGVKQSSISIVDIATKAVRVVIPDAYDPAWSRLP